MDDFLILLQAKLDEAKSKGNINANIVTLQDQLNAIKLQAVIDPQSINNIKTQLEGILNQKIPVSNIEINPANAVKDAQKARQKIKETVEKPIQQTLTIDPVIDKQVEQLMAKYGIAGKKGSQAFEEIRQSIVNYRKELIAADSTVTDPFDELSIFASATADINKVTTAIASQMRVVNDTKSAYQGLAEYIRDTNNSGNKIHIPQSFKAEYQDVFASMRSSLGKAFTTGKGTDFETFIAELNGQLGNIIDTTRGAEYAFGDLFEKLKMARSGGNFTARELLSNGFLDVNELKNDITSAINVIDAEEQKLVQSSATAANEFVQNEERKRQAVRETAEQINSLNAKDSIIKSGAGVKIFDDVEEARSHFKALLEEEKAVMAITERFDDTNALTSFSVNVKRATGDVESLRYTLDTLVNEEGEIERIFYKLSGSTFNDAGAKKQIAFVEKAFADFTQKIEQFKSTNSGKLSGLTEPLANFEQKLSVLKSGGNTIAEVGNAYKLLKAEMSKIDAAFESQLDKFNRHNNAVRNGKETISGLRAELKGLQNAPKELNQDLTQASKLLLQINKTEAKEGTTANWAIQAREFLDLIKSIESRIKVVKKEQANSASTQIFNADDLDKQGRVYLQKLNNTIEKTKSLIEGKLRKAGYADIEIKGVETANGKIKSLTATVTDATGALKQLNFERAKIQGGGKAQDGLIQTDDVKVMGNVSKAVEDAQRNLTNLKAKWTEQGVLVGEFKTKVESLEASLANVGSKGELDGLQAQIKALGNEAAKISKVNKIQLSFETGAYESKVETAISRTMQWTDQFGNARISTDSLKAAIDNLDTAFKALATNDTIANQNALIAAEKELKTQLDTVTNATKKMKAEFATSSAVDALRNKYQQFYDLNGKAHRKYGADMKNAMRELATGAEVPINRLRVLEQELVNTQNACRQAGLLGKTFFRTLLDGMKSFSYWTSSTFVVMRTIQSIKHSISTVVDLDTALVDLKKTTSMTNKELEEFYYNSNDIAKQMGVTTKEIISQAAEFSRLGYSSKEAATQMAKYSSWFKTISPGMSIEQAGDTLTSVMKAFKYEVSDVEKIMSVINTVGNNFAVSNVDIAEILTRSSSAMKEANNSLEDTIALGTAA